MSQQLLINNQWVQPENDRFTEIISPWDNKLIDMSPQASKAQAEAAMEAATAAFVSWRETSVAERVSIFEKAFALILSDIDELAELLSREIGKTRESAREEIERSVQYMQLVTQALMQMTGKIYYGDITGRFKKNVKTGLYSREPLGVVLAISPFNYPINLSATKIAPAILAGNSVVFKPSTQGSLSAYKFYSHFLEAGLPAGVLNIVAGRSSEIGDLLVTHPQTALIAFTGSTEVGDHIAEISKGVPLLMELGGKDTAIVTSKADLQIAASQITSGGFSYCGQRCTAQKLVLAYEEIADELVSMISAKAAKLELNPMINTEAADYIAELLLDAKSKGAEFKLEGSRDGNKFTASVLDKVTEQMRVFSEEQFGPILPVVRVNSEADAIQKLNSLQYGLQASVYTQDINEAFRIARQLEVGTVQINARPDRGPDNFPFGGVKGSGQLMQGTIETLELMTRGKLTVLNLSA